jgi:hypothetical protein
MNPTCADLGEKSLSQHSTLCRRTPESSQGGTCEETDPGFPAFAEAKPLRLRAAGAGVTGSRSRYFDAQGMIGTTLIAFAGEPSMTLELTAR